MRGVPQASVSRLPSLEPGLRWSSFLPIRLTRARRRRRSERLESVGRQRPGELRADSQSQLSRQWLRRF
jgi:hypothetical protein